MQATVSSFDPDSGAGTVLLDDGVELGFDPAAFARSGLRLLRPGQRVRVVTAGSGVDLMVSDLQILTLS
jgi:2-phospho-L-lactate guanylyltransferase